MPEKFVVTGYFRNYQAIMKTTFLFFITLFITSTLCAQIRVANYSFGKPGTTEYEHFEFSGKDGKPAEINYVYGKSRKELKLRNLGKDSVNGTGCFKVGFPNSLVLYIIPEELQLQVTDTAGRYSKTFTWEYEGPLNGVGMFCDLCATDDEDAMNLIRSVYMK
jgi:hypothetical protein